MKFKFLDKSGLFDNKSLFSTYTLAQLCCALAK